MGNGTFATVVNCIDGRVHPPVSAWMQQNLGAEFIDRITEPGPDLILSEGTPAQIESIRSKILISVNAHGSKNVVIVGHHDCAGNPVSKEVHLDEVRRAVANIKSWALPVRVIGLWVNEMWQVEKVPDSAEEPVVRSVEAVL